MLEGDYLAQLAKLTGDVDWDIELPRQWSNFFDEKGHAPTCPSDERHNQRYRLRTHGLMYFVNPLPAFPRTKKPVGVYTCDFSRHGCGILSSAPLFPEEQIRVLLPTFWTVLTVVRVRRITKRCFEIGLKLNKRFDPSEEAFGELSADVLLSKARSNKSQRET